MTLYTKYLMIIVVPYHKILLIIVAFQVKINIVKRYSKVIGRVQKIKYPNVYILKKSQMIKLKKVVTY